MSDYYFSVFFYRMKEYLPVLVRQATSRGVQQPEDSQQQQHVYGPNVDIQQPEDSQQEQHVYGSNVDIGAGGVQQASDR